MKRYGRLPPRKVNANALRKTLDADVRAAIAEEEPVGPPSIDTLFEDVYGQAPWHLREQREELVAAVKRRPS